MSEQHFIMNVSVVNLYGRPDFEASVVSQALLGETCHLVEESDFWVKVRQWDQYMGWVPRTQGILADTPYRANYTYRGFSTRIYLSANKEQSIRDIVYGCQLDATPLIQGGYSLVLPDGSKGWAEGPFANTIARADRDTIAVIARSFLGVPYMWGGKSPRGFDCSGFTQTVFQSVGVSLPRDSQQQAEYFQDQIIEYSQAQVGDLLFFGTTENITHVAIYLGQERLIHSQGWVREQSFNPQEAGFNERLKEKFLFICSIEKVLIA